MAGTDARLVDAIRLMRTAGAVVALVSPDHAIDDVALRFRADPTEPEVWDRVAMHVEQHLGPVDGVVTDAGAAAVVTAVFAPDLRRRGHGQVVVVNDDDVASVVSRLTGTR